MQTSRRSTRAAAFQPAMASVHSIAHARPQHVAGSLSQVHSPASSSRSMIARPSVATRAAATEAQAAPAETKEVQWYALVASAEFFFGDVQNESVAEQLRERVRFLKEQGKERDFHIVPQPTWLDTKFPAEAKRVSRPCVALVGSDKNWIVFMKLRLDRVLRIDLKDMTKAEVLSVGGTLPVMPTSPKKWTAPYPPYSTGWYERFLPENQ
eukprot:CAMPEP_0119106956 /NCGR_PEP_ID=MMETSP1180-20130426/7718_1 /TAXON_ID=3052 ORGANISM="Chlamydomonas cf sp, Strain CCMP681" /NCGR_SAMPLE_ID=MMETSP1180 /ASSEMBLY_ACC=CAM_ASM_000741 /LENGTH=209 /DNA_ID=CAMNT_0007092369 /DNA_START=87 /DNA_END=716 /DNA_ORIENTATION=+